MPGGSKYRSLYCKVLEAYLYVNARMENTEELQREVMFYQRLESTGCFENWKNPNIKYIDDFATGDFSKINM